MSNRGVYPVDPLTPVGQFRLASGDVISVPLTPPEVGFQDYRMWSDDEITVFLSQGGDSVNRSIGYAWLQASGAAALQSKSVKN